MSSVFHTTDHHRIRESLRYLRKMCACEFGVLRFPDSEFVPILETDEYFKLKGNCLKIRNWHDDHYQQTASNRMQELIGAPNKIRWINELYFRTPIGEVGSFKRYISRKHDIKWAS